MASTENMPPLPEAVAALKDEGNGFFRAGDFLKAAGAYTKALKVRPVARARASRPAFSNHAFLEPTICGDARGAAASTALTSRAPARGSRPPSGCRLGRLVQARAGADLQQPQRVVPEAEQGEPGAGGRGTLHSR